MVENRIPIVISMLMVSTTEEPNNGPPSSAADSDADADDADHHSGGGFAPTPCYAFDTFAQCSRIPRNIDTLYTAIRMCFGVGSVATMLFVASLGTMQVVEWGGRRRAHHTQDFCQPYYILSLILHTIAAIS